MPEINPILSLDELRKQANIQLKKFANQERCVQEYKSTLGLLLKRYHANESKIGKLAFWYGNLYWPIQISLMSAVVLVVSVIGVLLNISLLLGFLTSCIGCVVHYLLVDYYNTHNTWKDEFAEDIMNFEKGIIETIQHITAIEDQLKIVLSSSCSMNLEQVDDLSSFKVQISALQAQIEYMKTIILDLEQTKLIFEQELTKFKGFFEKKYVEFSDLNQSTHLDTKSLNQTGENIKETSISISKDEETLSAMVKSLNEKNLSLDSLITNLSLFMDKDGDSVVDNFGTLEDTPEV